MMDRKALAALEFALATPLLVVILTGTADFGLTQSKRVKLAEAVQAGVAYVNVMGVAALQADPDAVEDVIRMTMAVPDADLSVTVNAPARRCLGATGVLGGAGIGLCTIDALPASYFVTMTVTYSNPGLMTGFLPAAIHHLTETKAVRVTTP